MRWALENGADFVATGHYARVLKKHGQYQLARAKDAGKDQSYFLHRLKSNDLSRILFPIGELQKSEVRAIAKKFALPVAEKRDSQGLCFIGAVSMEEFLSRYIPLSRGDVVNERDEVVGSHSGAALYTIGQRHGFTAKGGEMHYITAIDVEHNLITVSTSRKEAARSNVTIRDLHWIGGTPNLPCPAEAQARYRETSVPVTVNSDFAVTFAEPHIAAPGQSIVFYDDEVCLGGAIIA